MGSGLLKVLEMFPYFYYFLKESLDILGEGIFDAILVGKEAEVSGGAPSRLGLTDSRTISTYQNISIFSCCYTKKITTNWEVYNSKHLMSQFLLVKNLGTA